jgi:type II secretory ATPase GspE/PulE/Tfp pilus assembly ATPase PilB-like protein
MQTEEKKPIATTVRLRSIIEYGISIGARAIHIEPRKYSIAIRYRVGNSLKEERHLSKAEYASLLAQLKIRSNLHVTEHQSSQQGHFTHSHKKNEFKVNVVILPVLDGEKIVLHLQNQNEKAPTLTSLGFWGQGLRTIQQTLALSRGLVLINGKRGTGKSATLFSLLQTLVSSGLSVATIEDPIRHVIRGAHQTQVNHKKGITTEHGLRTILEQDADALFVHQLHGQEISRLIERAVEKGHLVFGSSHTDNGADTLYKLVQSGLDKYTTAKHFHLAIGHEQVRTLCNNCKQMYTPTEEEVAKILQAFSHDKNLAMEKLHLLEIAAKDSGIAAERKLSTSFEKIEHLFKARQGGCQNCKYEGYKGTIGVFEIVKNTESLQKTILADLGIDALKKESQRASSLTIQQDAIVKMLRGITSSEQALNLESVKTQD